MVEDVKVVTDATQSSAETKEKEVTEISSSVQETAHAAARVIDQAIPLYRMNPPPQYPRVSRRRGQEGVVLLEALINIGGRVSEIKLLHSSGYALLDNAALKAVHNWHFLPGSIDGVLEEMRVKVPVRFRLN